MARGETNANGFAWDKRSKECFGIDDAIVINTKETFFTSCIFTSKSMYKKGFQEFKRHG